MGADEVHDKATSYVDVLRKYESRFTWVLRLQPLQLIIEIPGPFVLKSQLL